MRWQSAAATALWLRAERAPEHSSYGCGLWFRPAPRGAKAPSPLRSAGALQNLRINTKGKTGLNPGWISDVLVVHTRENGANNDSVKSEITTVDLELQKHYQWSLGLRRIAPLGDGRWLVVEGGGISPRPLGLSQWTPVPAGLASGREAQSRCELPVDLAGDEIISAGLEIAGDEILLVINDLVGAHVWSAPLERLNDWRRSGSVLDSTVIGRLFRVNDRLAATCLHRQENGADQIQYAVLGEDGWQQHAVADGMHLFAPAAEIDDAGKVHLAWCDLSRRLWYASIRADDPGAILCEAMICYESSRHVDVTVVDGAVLLAFESDINDVGYVRIEGGRVIAATETMVSSTHILWEKSKCGTHPAYVRDTMASSSRHLTRDVFHSPQFVWAADGCLWLLVANATRESVWGCRWLGKNWGPMINYGGLPVSPIRTNYARLRLGDFSAPRRFTGWPMVAHLEAEAPTPTNRVQVVCPSGIQIRPGHKILFFDLRELSRLEGLELVPLQAEKFAGNPVLQPEDPSAFDGARVFNSGTVMREAGKFRMWYGGMGSPDPNKPWWHWCKWGYAESDDGMRWQRVDLGKAYPPDANSIPEVRAYMVNILREPDSVDPEMRYKQLEVYGLHYERELAQAGQVDPSDGSYHGRLWFSPDGVNWDSESIQVETPSRRFLTFVPTSLMRDDDEPDPRMRYKAYGFTSMTRCRRTVALMCSADGRTWWMHPENSVIEPEDRGFPWVPSGPFSHAHDPAVFKYAGYYLAFYQYLDDPLGGGIEMAVSRDGVDFKLVFGEHTVIPRGGPGEWDRGLLVASTPVVHNNRIFLYYGGSDYRHESDGPFDAAKEDAMKICGGLAILREDGFSCLRINEESEDGFLETIPLELPNVPLQIILNADCGDGHIVTELADAATGIPLPGYAFADCHPLQEDGTALAVRWAQNQFITPRLPLRIRIKLTGTEKSPRLFSIGFKT